MKPFFFALLAASAIAGAYAQINTVQTIAPGVYFHEGDPRRGHSNNGWIVFDKFVLVVDANYPSGAKIVMPKIAETTNKPVRFVFNTHHHGDHAYGNQLWSDAGASLVATVAAFDEMQKVETGYFGGPPGRWEAAAAKRPDVAATKLKPPEVLFPRDLVIDDGTRRVELHFFGPGHTRGDGYVWLPKERILFTGDACVNGPHNNVADGDVAEWIKTLDRVKALGAEKVCPGHGPIGGPEIIADQQAYFVALRREVQALVDARRSSADVKAAVGTIGQGLKQNPQIARYVPANLAPQVQKVYVEMGGEKFLQ